MYMRLLGYPAERIAILTTYNGQKHLIRDVIRKRCGENPMIGWPSKVCQHSWDRLKFNTGFVLTKL